MPGEKDIHGAREGRRELKRRQTRGRIEDAAMALFLDRGFDQTTIEEITEAADVSKRSFFDYFPSKEDVVSAWQDTFADHLAEAIAARPGGEPMARVVEEALSATVVAAFNPQSLAVSKLIRATPTLSARDQLKYAKLESCLTAALLSRCADGETERLRVRLLSAAVIGAMRVGGEQWHQAPRGTTPEALFRSLFAELKDVLSAFGSTSA
ncbi:TetR family transcriptional regulator [Rhizobium sp. HT1-10]|uniref:TetR family transcriptional regulator n=1 Tax=Rhizobium sp. HT1-10 TaxID=3111638 RepID=UPI003C184594